MAKILIVAQQDPLLNQLISYLRQNHFGLKTMTNNADATRLAERHPGSFSLIILNWQGANSTTLSQIQRLRQSPTTAIMVVTTITDTAQKITVLTAGADDFVTEPLSLLELITRVRVLLRRQSGVQTSGSQFRYSDLLIDTKTRQVWRNGVLIQLTQREYQLLLVLVQHAEVQLSRADLLALAWGADFTGQPNLIDVYIRYLRQKLALTTTHQLIKTVRGVGYCLQA